MRGVGLGELLRMDVAELRAAFGLTPAQARRLSDVGELHRRLLRPASARPALGSVERACRLARAELEGFPREVFAVALLDGKHRLRRWERVSVGTLTASLVHPREVFRAAIREAAAAVVVAHNHPSGDPEPSTEDRHVTRRLVDAGRLLGIPVLDHVVVGDARCVSFRERGWLPASGG
jgi:DNA repair protein RadC